LMRNSSLFGCKDVIRYPFAGTRYQLLAGTCQHLPGTFCKDHQVDPWVGTHHMLAGTRRRVLCTGPGAGILAKKHQVPAKKTTRLAGL
jgi:hypothetical protein